MSDWTLLAVCVGVVAALMVGVWIGSIDQATAMNCIPIAPIAWDA